MDEVGRGTGTKDGLSIAWAVCEELLDHIKCRTLFATHYHELSLIAHSRMANRSMEVLDRSGEIVFLRKLKEGSAAESYGLQVARMAGLPEGVLQRAGRIMARLKENEQALQGALPAGLPAEGDRENLLPGLPEDDRYEKIGLVIEDLQSLDLNRMTPLEALSRLHAWQSALAGKTGRGPRGKHFSPSKEGVPTLFD
jgi:DNA mismatch repair protein MutS